MVGISVNVPDVLHIAKKPSGPPGGLPSIITVSGAGYATANGDYAFSYSQVDGKYTWVKGTVNIQWLLDISEWLLYQTTTEEAWYLTSGSAGTSFPDKTGWTEGTKTTAPTLSY